jgi:hypothetical protein
MLKSGYHAPVTEFEVASVEGRDVVTIVINGQMFDLPSQAASMLATDLKSAVKRIKGTK